MIWDEVLERFLQQRPIPVLLRGLCEHALPDSFLDQFFHQHAQVQYHRELTFSCVVAVLLKVVLRARTSVRSAALDDDRLTVSLTSLYDKLQGVETSLCAALVAATAGRLSAVFDHLPKAQRPAPIVGLRLLTVDGNYLAGSEHRLQELRDHPAAALPGMSVALREDRTGMITRLACREDAYTNERALTDDILAWIGADDLLLGDRNFCTLDLMDGIRRRQGFFLLRHHRQLHLESLSDLQYAGQTDTGTVYERRVRLGQGEEGPECRCIVVRLNQPTADGDTEIVLLSNVTAEKADAVTLANLYRRRWKIEASYQEMTDYLKCEVNTLAYPKAALFGFTLAVVAYNLLAVLKGALASLHGVAKVEDELSSYALADQIATVTEGMLVALPSWVWQRFQQLTAQEMAVWLLQGAQNLQWVRFKKTKRAPKKPKKKQPNSGSPHRSTARLLQNRQKK